MKALMNSWRRRASWYGYWMDKEMDDSPPLISFSLDAFVLETRPASYYDYNDTDRWRILYIWIKVSRYFLNIEIPFKKLPDYVPTGKAMLRTRSIGAINKDKRDAFLEMVNASKKV